MKFTCSVEINEHIDRVVNLWKDEKNLKEWQDGYQGMEHISGEYDKEGSQYLLKYIMRNKPMELKETILKHNLPDEYLGKYEHIYMTNTMRNSFIDLGNNRTRYESTVHYTEFRTFSMKIMKTLFPGMFKKQVQKWMNQFKAFAERENINA
ncbi:MAG: SRPBCC family protein [Bacteroidota bacterium]